MKRVAGIRPGGGKAANEFDELDAEDKAIAEYEEKKAQAGIPPGADHPGPGQVSRKYKAIEVSRDKAKGDMILSDMEEEAHEGKQEEPENTAGGGSGGGGGGDDDDDYQEDVAEADDGDKGEPIDPKDIKWFRTNFRLRELSKEHLGGLAFTREVGISPDIIGAYGSIPKSRAGIRFVERILWDVYLAHPEYLEGPTELERREKVCSYIKSKTAMRDGMGYTQTEEEKDQGQPLEPWHKVLVLEEAEVKRYAKARKLRAIMSNYYAFSEPFTNLRDYLIFLVVFLIFIYVGRDDTKFWLKRTMDDYITLNEYSPTYNFEAITNTGQLYSWMNNLFLPVMFPQVTAGGAELSCEGKQYMEDGTNFRVGNIRMRQIKVGLNRGKAWSEDKTADYSTCTIPSKFEDSMDRCFAPWGYKEKMGDLENNQFKKRWKSMKWANSVDLHTPSIYNSPTRHRFPGSGYTKLLANNYDLAQEDLDNLFRKTWIDIQTRAVFIEFTALNVPNTYVISAVLMLEYGAEGDVLPSTHYTISTVYKTYLILTTALDMMFTDVISAGICAIFSVLAAFVTLVVCNPWGADKPSWLGGQTKKERGARIKAEKAAAAAALAQGAAPMEFDTHTFSWKFSIFAALTCGFAFGVCIMSIYYSYTFNKAASDYIAIVFEIITYTMVGFQIVDEYRLLLKAKHGGDSFVSHIFNPYNTIQYLNLGLFVLAAWFRILSLVEMHFQFNDFESAIANPCTRGNYTAGWDENVPEGCWGTERVAPLFIYGDDQTSEEAATMQEAEAAWSGSMYSRDYVAGEKYVDYGDCPSVKKDKRLSSQCCAKVGYMNLQWAVYYDSWVDQITAFNALLLFLKFFRYVRMFRTLALFSETMKESTRRMVTITIIIGIIMTGFSMAFHLAFGFRDPAYRDFPEAVKTLFEIILGSFDMSLIRTINPYLGPFFFYAFILIMIMVVLSMFVAIVDNAYSDTSEKMLHMEYAFIRDELWTYCVTKRRATVTREERRKLREAKEQRERVLNCLKRVGTVLRYILLGPCIILYELLVCCKIVKPKNRWKTDEEKAAATDAAEEKASRASSEAGNPAVYPPIDGPQRLFEELHLSRDFLLEPCSERLTSEDRQKLHKAIKYIEQKAMPDTAGEDYEEPEMVSVRRPDGKTEDGTETKLIIRNTEGFRRKLSIVSGHDVVLVKDDIIHVYFQIFRHYPFKLIRKLFPTVQGFRDWLTDGDDEVYKEEITGESAINHVLADAEGDDNAIEIAEEEKEAQEAIEEKKRKHEELVSAVKELDSEELSFLHKLEVPKLSLIREVTHLEDQQRRILAQIEDLNRRSRNVATEYMKLTAKKEAVLEARRKDRELEEAGRVTSLLEE